MQFAVQAFLSAMTLSRGQEGAALDQAWLEASR